MKKVKRLLFISLFFILFIIMSNTISNAGYQKYNLLDFQAYLNSDGSMKVIETWDITISETNTIFKNFAVDDIKYTGIEDVKVTDITEGEKPLEQIYTEMYHVTKDCYYALYVEPEKFEIAWGVGLDNKKADRKYRIEYTVVDAVSIYNDCSQLYWQFVGKDNGITAQKVTGTIYLPKKANSKEEIRVWGHTEGLNGEIYVTDLDKVEFSINDLLAENFVELRILMPENIIETSGIIYDKDIVQEVLEEEKVWADEANRIREKRAIEKLILNVFILIISIIIAIILIMKIRKYSKIQKQYTTIIKPSQEIQYFREIPRETASPAEARLLVTKNKFDLYTSELGDIFSGTLLDLYNSEFIDINVDNQEKENVIFILRTTEENIQDIPNEDEKLVYEYMLKAAEGKKEITLKELQKYITKYPSKITDLQKKIEKCVKNKLYDMKYLNKTEEETRNKFLVSNVFYIIFILISLLFTFVGVFGSNLYILILVILVLIPLLISCSVKINKIIKCINVYSQEAIDEVEMWNGLKKFMTDLSQLDKKEVPELILWEKYLVYATAFGIADKVLKQLKLIYPDFETNMQISTYTHMHIILSSNISNSISSSIRSSISSVTSSGYGGGGGFSGGGRRRRRPEVAQAEDK